METYPDKKKKNFAGGWLNRFLPPRSFEFETPLTPHECYERLQKLPGKMTYLKAKSKVELANAGMQAFQLQWKPEENVCEFAQSGRNQQEKVTVALQGKVFVSDIYETTLVRGRIGDDSRQSSFRSDLLPYIIVGLIVPVIASAIGGFPLGSMATIALPIFFSMLACSFLFVLFLVVAVGIPHSRANMKLLQNFLTEPDESQL